MDPLSILQGALSLLGRPGNAVRGAIIDPDHMEGFGRGISGQQQYDGTDLPGINSLPDEGPSFGPLHITPRTVGGFAGSALLDPLTYLGGPLGRAGEGLAGLARGADATGGLLDSGARLTPELRGIFQGGVTHDHFRLPELPQQGELDSALAEGRLPAYQRMSRSDDERYNTMSPEELQAFHPGTAGEEMHQADVPEYDYSNLSRSGRAEFTGLRPGYGDFEGRTDTDLRLFGDPNRMSQDPQHLIENALGRLRRIPEPVEGETTDLDPSHNSGVDLPNAGTGRPYAGGLREQGLGPTNEPTPLGDQDYAQGKDAVAKARLQLTSMGNNLDAAQRWLDTGAEDLPGVGGRGAVEQWLAKQQEVYDQLSSVIRDRMLSNQSDYAERSLMDDGNPVEDRIHNMAARNVLSTTPSNGGEGDNGLSGWINSRPYLMAKSGDPEQTIANVQSALHNWRNAPETGGYAYDRAVHDKSLQEVNWREQPDSQYYNGKDLPTDQASEDDTVDPSEVAQRGGSIPDRSSSGAVTGPDGKRLTFAQYRQALQAKGGQGQLTPDEYRTLRGSRNDAFGRQNYVGGLNRYDVRYQDMPGMSHSESVDAQLEKLTNLDPETGLPMSPDEIPAGEEYDRYSLDNDLRDMVSPKLAQQVAGRYPSLRPAEDKVPYDFQQELPGMFNHFPSERGGLSPEIVNDPRFAALVNRLLANRERFAF